MRYGADTETSTFKCEGCGKRYPDELLTWLTPKILHTLNDGGRLPPGLTSHMVVTVCSVVCGEAAALEKKRQQYGTLGLVFP